MVVDKSVRPTPRRNFTSDIPTTSACLQSLNDTIKHDHTYTMLFENIYTKISKVNVQMKSLKTKLKLQQQSSRRLKSRVKLLKNVIKTLKRKDLISSNCKAMWKQHFEGLPLALFTRKISTLKKSILKS